MGVSTQDASEVLMSQVQEAPMTQVLDGSGTTLL
jgi:hypothetical protein